MFKKLAEGDVYCNETLAAAGPRVARLPGGGLVCAFSVHRAGGTNDFYPMVSYSEDGIHWSESKPVWPELIDKKSIFASIRPTADGRVSLAGKVWPIYQLGESFWSGEVGGMLENKLMFSISEDGKSFPLDRKSVV